MICTPGRMLVQLSQDVYQLMRKWRGGQDRDKWERRTVVCLKCGNTMQNRSLRQHLAGVHNIYNNVVVEEHLLD